MFKILSKYLSVVLKALNNINLLIIRKTHHEGPLITKQEKSCNQGSTISAHRNPNYLSIQLGAQSNTMLSNKKVNASHTF